MNQAVCHLCQEPIIASYPAEGYTFCCHGCRELWRILGEEQLQELKQRPGINWSVWREQSHKTDQDAPLTFEPKMVTMDLDGLWCASCSILIEEVLQRTPGVVAARVNFTARTADIAIDGRRVDGNRLAAIVRRLGYGAKEHTGDTVESHADLALHQRLGISAMLAVVVMMLSIPIWSNYFGAFPIDIRDILGYSLWILTTPILFWGGWPFLRGAWSSVCHLVPTMDLLVTLGSGAAYVYSVAALLLGGRYLYFDTSAMLITFLLLSRTMEVATRNRATEVVRVLSGLTNPKACVLRQPNNELEVSVDQVAVGDLVVVRPGQQIPVDGLIADGSASINETFLTGEPVPVDKTKGDRVYAGTTNMTGRLLIQTTRVYRDSLLAKTTEYVRAAQAAEGPWRRLANQILRYFVPGVIVVALVTLASSLWVGHLSPTAAVLRTIAVLVIACPCALSVATPISVLAGARRLSQLGFLIRSDEALDRASTLDTVMLDKTGTLTRGELHVTSVTVDTPNVLIWAASLEAASEHPIGVAIIREAERRHLSLLPVREFHAEPGWGVEGFVADHQIRVRTPMATDTVNFPSGMTIAVIEVDGVQQGWIALRDQLRPESHATVDRLQKAGYQVLLVTGDQPSVAELVARETGCDAWLARQSPLEKAEIVHKMQQAGHRVAFVGDGINDAVALIQSNLAIALAQGADIAVEAGHLTLSRSDLTTIPEALTLAKKTSRVIRQNLLWALGYNVLAIPAAAVGLVEPVVAAGAMVLSSAFVLGNSLTILGWSPRQYVVLTTQIAGFLLVLGVLGYWRI